MKKRGDLSMTTRKVILDLAITLDGFIEGPNGEVDWCIMDAEMEFPKFLSQIDTIFYGRKSYDSWGHYKPKPKEPKSDQIMWTLIHSKKKYVFSNSPKAKAKNVTYIYDNIAEQVEALKQQPGKDIWLYGGAGLITSFMNLGLIDEFRLSVHPVLLGAGKPLFVDIHERLHLQLVDTRTFSSGVVQLIYTR